MSEDLQKENKELKDKVAKLELVAKLNRVLAEQRAGTINKMLQSEINSIKAPLLEEQKLLVQKMVTRINSDNQKYDLLQNFLLKEFPDILKPNKQNTEAPETRDDLSTSYIGENGKVYEAQHIIDVAIYLMSNLKKQIKDILGRDYTNEGDDSDLF